MTSPHVIHAASTVCDLMCAGRELWHNARSVTVDYNTLDPVVRRDSYQYTSFQETGTVHFYSDVYFTFCCTFGFLLSVISLDSTGKQEI